MTTRIAALSVEYVRVPVAARESGSAVDPTSDVVKMAFVAVGETPAADDWHTAEWEPDGDTYYARVLVGEAIALTVGSYDVWVQVYDAVETPTGPAQSGVEIF